MDEDFTGLVGDAALEFTRRKGPDYIIEQGICAIERDSKARIAECAARITKLQQDVDLLGRGLEVAHSLLVQVGEPVPEATETAMAFWNEYNE